MQKPSSLTFLPLPQKDHYRTFAHLSEHEIEGRDYLRYIKHRDSRIAIIAPHGGGIERGTSEIAKALAANEHSIYCFEGIKRTNNKPLHITSTRFDDPLCIALLHKSDIVIAIHGCTGDERVVYVGGRDDKRSSEIIAALNAVGLETMQDNDRHRGKHVRNLCNLGRSKEGIQIEITEGLRRTMFAGLKRHQRKTTTPVFGKFIDAITGLLQKWKGHG